MINIFNTRVTLVSGSAVIGVRCEQEGAGHAALGDSGVVEEVRLPECEVFQSATCVRLC